MSGKPLYVVFICTGNTCRSPMAEGFASKMGADGFYFMSKGICAYPGKPSLFAINAMKEHGIDISGKKSEQITNKVLEKAAVVLTMTSSHKMFLLDNFNNVKEKIFTLSEFASDELEDIIDPFGMDIDVYRQCADEIKKYVEKALPKLMSLNPPI